MKAMLLSPIQECLFQSNRIGAVKNNKIVDAVDRNGQRFSEQIGESRLKPLRGAEGGLDSPICSEHLPALRSTAFLITVLDDGLGIAVWIDEF